MSDLPTLSASAESSTPFCAPRNEELVARCLADGEFGLAARHWNGGFRFHVGDAILAATLHHGTITAGDPGEVAAVVDLHGGTEVWEQLLAAVPAPHFTDITPALRRGLRRSGDELTYWQYLPALQRAVELLRAEPAAGFEHPVAAHDRGPTPRLDSPVGRYIHLELGGVDHRVYFEEAGEGIPILAQHTAGSHGVQWRHLFEMPAVTDHFRLIAYDLPFHGKSIPPVGPQWWAEPYRLTGEFVRSVPVALAAALGLHRPVFMGCSVGGLLALDLALHHPDLFRAVISLEGALRVGGDLDALLGFWHPGVSNDSKARMMQGITSPASPLAYRKETAQTYASGWPAAFIGDLNYYCVEYDLRPDAAAIDTTRVGVHILNGTYDYSASPGHGAAAQAAIAGSTFTEMLGLGHFPMSEDPEAFAAYLLPVLDTIRGVPAS